MNTYNFAFAIGLFNSFLRKTFKDFCILEISK